jgi:hypothetical protein
MDEVWHAHNTIDIARVITEEYAPKSSKGADEVGFGGHRSFNAIWVHAPNTDDSASRHGGEGKRSVRRRRGLDSLNSRFKAMIVFPDR